MGLRKVRRLQAHPSAGAAQGARHAGRSPLGPIADHLNLRLGSSGINTENLIALGAFMNFEVELGSIHQRMLGVGVLIKERKSSLEF